MKKRTLNNFSKGLVTDFNPLTAPKDVLVEAQNIEFITTEGNQVILQKRVGNDPELWEDVAVEMTAGFKPVAVKELNNVAYIISHNEDTGEGEIGSFPSPDYADFKWEPLGGNISNDVVPLPPDFNDGLRDDAVFTVTPTAMGEEYVVKYSAHSYIFTVENLGNSEDTYLIDYPSDLFLNQAASDYITVASGATGDFVMDLKTDDDLFEEGLTLYVTSMLDASKQEQIIWDSLWIYNPGPVPTVAKYWTVARDTESNIDEASAITAIDEDEVYTYGVVYIEMVFDPNYAPYRIDIKITSGLVPALWWRFGIDAKYLTDGAVELIDNGYPGDAAPTYPDYSVGTIMTYAKLNKPAKFKIILPEVWKILHPGGSGPELTNANIEMTFTKKQELGGTWEEEVPQGIVNFEGDFDYNIYYNNNIAQHAYKSAAGTPEDTKWWWYVHTT